jgi:hypothetical protein
MALPFLKSEKRDPAPAASSHMASQNERPTAMAPQAASQRATSLAGLAKSMAGAAISGRPAAPAARPPGLTAIDGGMKGQSTASEPSSRDPDEAVRARVAAIRSAQTPLSRPGEIVSVARFAKSMRDRSRAAQYDKTKAMVGRIEQLEIDMLIDIGAKTRARYISKLLEIGRANKPLSFSASEEVRGLREQHEEIMRGLDLLREALERGEVEIEGVEVT